MSLKEINHEVDLCVIGGGFAGICTAISAARHGVRVALMHERAVFGGNASSEIRMWVCGADGENNRETGLIEEILLDNLYFNPDKSYPAWDSLLFSKVKAEKGIEVLLNCTCCEAEMDKNRIVSVVGYQMTTQARHRVRAKYFADCSGDSILAPLTGADFRIGREGPDEFNERTSYSEADSNTMGNSCLIQARKTRRKTKFTPPLDVRKITKEEMDRRGFAINEPRENFWYLELGGDRSTIDDAESIRDELISLALGAWDYIKNSGNVADADYWELEFLGFLPGKRESRRMMGDYIMTQRDIVEGKRFEDCVCYGGWPLDDHHPDGFDYKKRGYYVNEPTPSPYQIPYRCLYSRNIENLFFAGRNISMTHAGMSSTRVMATCALMGQAIGTASYVAKKYGASPRGVYEKHIKELQEELMRDGCFLPYMKRTQSKALSLARLSGENCKYLENLRNGADRNNKTYSQAENGAYVPLDSELCYTLDSPSYIKEVRLAFDSDLNRATLPGDWCERYHSMRCNYISAKKCPSMHLPKTLVRDFELVLKRDEEEQVIKFKDNRRQTIRVPINKELDSVSLRVSSLWSSDSVAHIFSFEFD